MEYKIGSFNLHNIGQTALGMNNQRDLKTIARIIREEHFDIVALQEILSEGKAFIGEDYAKKSILMELGPGWDFCWADAEAENDRRHEGFAFVWNNKRLRKCTTEVRRGSGANNSTFQRTFEPRICRVNHKYMERKPFYGRFTANGMPGGTNVEFRLLCVHSFYGQKDDKADREKRLRELNILLQDIYPQINDRRYGDTYDDSYTIVLGDYNAEVWTSKSKKWQEELKKQRGGKRPAVLPTDDDGVIESSRYPGRKVKTVQYELTTLKSKIGDNGEEEYDTAGYSFNYDHFSFEEDKFKGVKPKAKALREAVYKYSKVNNEPYESDFEKYFKTISDHIPVVLTIDLKQR